MDALSMSYASLPLETIACLYMESSSDLLVYIRDKFSSGSVSFDMISSVCSY